MDFVCTFSVVVQKKMKGAIALQTTHTCKVELVDFEYKITHPSNKPTYHTNSDPVIITSLKYEVPAYKTGDLVLDTAKNMNFTAENLDMFSKLIHGNLMAKRRKKNHIKQKILMPPLVMTETTLSNVYSSKDPNSDGEIQLENNINASMELVVGSTKKYDEFVKWKTDYATTHLFGGFAQKPTSRVTIEAVEEEVQVEKEEEKEQKVSPSLPSDEGSKWEKEQEKKLLKTAPVASLSSFSDDEEVFNVVPGQAATRHKVTGKKERGKKPLGTLFRYEIVEDPFTKTMSMGGIDVYLFKVLKMQNLDASESEDKQPMGLYIGGKYNMTQTETRVFFEDVETDVKRNINSRPQSPTKIALAINVIFEKTATDHDKVLFWKLLGQFIKNIQSLDENIFTHFISFQISHDQQMPHTDVLFHGASLMDLNFETQN